MANDTLSINKIVSIFRDLSLRQKMVADFGYGPTYNIGASRQMKFPYIWVEQNSTTTSKSDNGYKEAYLTFTIFCMDKISMGDDNYDEIISDTHYILDTIIQEISQHKYYIDMNLSIDGDINFDPVVEGTDDNVNGWQADITLKMPIRYTPCNSPIEPISGYTTQLNSSIVEYRLQGTSGTSGTSGSSGSSGTSGITQPKNGLFAQILDGTPVSGTITETNIIGVGVGTLSVPANGFVVGDSFTAFLDGRISCINTSTLHIHVRTLGGVLLADTGIITLQTSTNKNWKLDIQFTIRSLGGPGVASISSGGLFGYVRNSGSNYEGSVLSTINNTTFDTTIDNTLIITAQWNTTNAGNSILCRNFTLTKTY